ncbi:MAG TPA: electron transport complex subunit RsxG [Gammaproteobacteria bacterium]|nr:electron transport complex subunit RsxG [Gammaproteobacteria bacterium]
MSYRSVLISAIFLFLFAVGGTGLVAFTHDNTADRIAENQRRALLRSIHELIPQERYDNDIFNDVIYVRDPKLLGTDEPVAVYRARKNGWPVAAVLAPVAPDGYSGRIRLLVAINTDGTLAGVRAVEHHETPGLGDHIEVEKSDWILGFNGKSLNNPPEDRWKVKRDGGDFDQFTGATITPRAVVKAVHKALLYYRAHGQELFAQHPKKAASES